MAAADLLEEVVRSDDASKKAVSRLREILAEKSIVSYSGEAYTEKKAAHLWKHLERFQSWAESILG